jgi:hypothetical protein
LICYVMHKEMSLVFTNLITVRHDRRQQYTHTRHITSFRFSNINLITTKHTSVLAPLSETTLVSL